MFSIDDIERASAELRRLLEREVAASPAEAILLSGGLDTSILALLYSRAQPQKPLRAITVCLEENSISEPDLRKVAEEWGIEAGLLPSPDKYFACSLARLLGLEHRVISVTARQLLDLMPEVIAHLETFDPMELRNSVVVYCGLRAAARLGLKSIVTGDGADELFAGYSYMYQLGEEELSRYLNYIARIMTFSSKPLGRALGIKVKTPYTSPEIKKLALAVKASMHVGHRSGRKMGKWLLRLAFAGELPDEFIWRVKTPIEYGSGSTFLPAVIEAAISNAEFAAKRNEVLQSDGVRLRDKEQLYYYQIYRGLYGAPQRGQTAPLCPDCGSALTDAAGNFCRRCGAWGFEKRSQNNRK